MEWTGGLDGLSTLSDSISFWSNVGKAPDLVKWEYRTCFKSRQLRFPSGARTCDDAWLVMVSESCQSEAEPGGGKETDEGMITRAAHVSPLFENKGVGAGFAWIERA